MANNFKLTGTVYVSIDGSDSNSGLTKDLPKRTIQAGLNALSAGGTLVIGNGVYLETLSKQGTNGTFTLTGDGMVVVGSYSAAKQIVTAPASNGAFVGIFSNITFVNYTLTASGSGSIGTNNNTFTRCNFISCTVYLNPLFGSTQTVRSVTNCISINSTFSENLSATTSTFSKSIFLNSSITTGGPITIGSCSFDGTSSILSTLASTTCNYNNIQSTCALGSTTASTVTSGMIQDKYGRYYDLSQAGTNPSGNGSFAQPFYRGQTNSIFFNYTNYRIAYPTLNVNSISSDPKYNNIQSMDFTLQADSPNLGRAGDGTNIGGTNYAVRYAANGAVFLADAVSVTDLNFLGTDYTITSPATSGEVVGAPIQLGTSLSIVQKVTYNGLLEFNKAITGGLTGNRNVPDQEVYDSTTQPPDVQGANPDRLVYYLRYSTQVTEPATNAEWDNGGYITAGDYFTMEWNTKPSFDTAFLGNGAPAFDTGASPTYINATWIQLKVKLRNDY